MNSATEHAELDYWRRLIPPVRSRSACEQLFQLRELFGQAFRRTGEGFVAGRFCGVEFV